MAWLASALAGCSFAIPSLVAAPEETTGSITRISESRLFPELGTEEWRRARGALALALDPQGNGRPVKWDNPESGMRGEIVPAGAPYVEADEICRAFTATLEKARGLTRSIEGEACRLSADEWALKNLRKKRVS